MVIKNTYRILIWIIIILLASNLSMGFSFWYHKQQEKKAAKSQSEQVEIPSEQRVRFFREQLNLNHNQVEVFRELSRDYNRNARQIAFQLQELRFEMIEEMGNSEPNSINLDSISENIGTLHTRLKRLTISYYLNMKKICDENQEIKLNEIFLSMSKSEEDVSLPQRGRKQHGRQQSK